jgi:hypothetical protein
MTLDLIFPGRGGADASTSRRISCRSNPEIDAGPDQVTTGAENDFEAMT